MDAETARATWICNIETGELWWKVARGRSVKSGDKAGSKKKTGRKNDAKEYIIVSFNGRGYRAHRLIWLITYGEWPSCQIDHIDGNGLNNKLENLRDVSSEENSKNSRLPKDNKSGRCGVYWHKQSSKWAAQINYDGKQLHLGLFDKLGDAVAARKEAEVKYGYHPNHGTRRDGDR